MDHFIKKENYASAARVASFLMLQEDFGHPISNAFALYSCHKYLENPDSWKGIDPESLKEPEPKEEVKIRVPYIINPWFDDHFDLWKPSDLTGKTLFWIGSLMDNLIGRTCHVRGLVLYKKFNLANKLLKSWNKNQIKNVVYKEVFDLIKKDNPEIFSKEGNEEVEEVKSLLSELENSKRLYEMNLTEDLQNHLKECIKTKADEDITHQNKVIF